MDKWDNKPSRKQHHRENPSFSSTLLDVIYRSIDEDPTEEKEEAQLIFYRETMRKQKQGNCFREEKPEAEKHNSRRARKVENWMEKRASEKVLMGRNSLTEFERRTRSNSISNTLSMYSSSTSSESSSVGGFSSSESESFYYGVQRPKPIKTSVSDKTKTKTNFDASLHSHNFRSHSSQSQKPKHENGFGKTKSKALKILYGELKKAKQPISPGAKLASFLNSLFTSTGNAKKAKVSTTTTSTYRPVLIPIATDRVADTKSVSAAQQQPGSTCSSASSFSRSCLSKTPSSRSGAKRSVRFCPVSVIVDEDCRPCGHKNLHEGEESLVDSRGKNRSEELRLHVMQESRRVEELARDLLKNYQKKSEVEFDDVMHYEDEEEEDDDDVASCASSDLFELDNLSAIGIERYREELPVYETTHFNTNRAIANGFIL